MKNKQVIVSPGFVNIFTSDNMLALKMRLRCFYSVGHGELINWTTIEALVIYHLGNPK